MNKPINLTKIMRTGRKIAELDERASRYWRVAADSSYSEFLRRTYSEEAEKAGAELREARATLRQLLSGSVDAAIKEAEGRADARCITGEKIVETLIEVEDKLVISRKAMEKITVDVDLHAQNKPRAYKYEMLSTQFTAEFRAGHWILTGIERDEVRAPSRRIIIHHTDTSRQAVLDRFTCFD